jgi:hypothetical protein
MGYVNDRCATCYVSRQVLARIGAANIMSTRELIDRELTELPEQLQKQVYDFVRFLRLQASEDGFNGLLLSESALAEEWDTPEEDAAWANL